FEYVPDTTDGESDDDLTPLQLKPKYRPISIIPADRPSDMPQTNSCLVGESSLTNLSNATDSQSRHIGVQGKDALKKYDKQNSCFYCFKLFKKITKHLLDRHSKEKEVSEIQDMPVNSSERKKAWDYLRNYGNFNYNVKILKAGNGYIIVARRSRNCNSYKDYIPCYYCYGFFHKKEMYKHCNHCKFQGVISHKNHVKSGRVMLASFVCHRKYKELHENIICTMQQDDVTETVRDDQLLQLFGTILLEKNGLDHKNYISQRIRQLARLLLKVNKDNNLSLSLLELLDPNNFDLLINATKNLTYISDPSKSKPVGLKLGHSIRKCCLIAKSEALTNKHIELITKLDNFIFIFDTEWTDRISSQTLSNLCDSKTDSEQELSVTEDICKLSNYLDSNISDLIKHNIMSPHCLEVDTVNVHNYMGKMFDENNPLPLLDTGMQSPSMSSTSLNYLNDNSQNNEPDDPVAIAPSPENPLKRRKITPYKREKWSPELKCMALDFFKQNIQMKKAPGKTECTLFIEQTKCDRSWVDIKNLIKNTYYGKS
ncbi:unnamed protein product, partial [Meganyctiphanes norvegica]